MGTTIFSEDIEVNLKAESVTIIGEKYGCNK
jgi:hypothetical protein